MRADLSFWTPAPVLTAFYPRLPKSVGRFSESMSPGAIEGRGSKVRAAFWKSGFLAFPVPGARNNMETLTKWKKSICSNFWPSRNVPKLKFEALFCFFIGSFPLLFMSWLPIKKDRKGCYQSNSTAEQGDSETRSAEKKLIWTEGLAGQMCLQWMTYLWLKGLNKFLSKQPHGHSRTLFFLIYDFDGTTSDDENLNEDRLLSRVI